MPSTTSISQTNIARPPKTLTEAARNEIKAFIRPNPNSAYKPSVFDLALVFGSCIDFPLSLFSSISAAAVKNPYKPVNLGNNYLNSLLHFTAGLYPLSLIFSSFLGLLQGIIAASPLRILTYLFVVPSILFALAPAEFKSMSLANEIGFFKDHKLEKEKKTDLDNLYKQLQDTNGFLSFFTKSPYLSIVALTFLSLFADTSRDNPSGKDFSIKPFIYGEVKNLKDFANLLIENGRKEIKSCISSLEVFDPKKIRWTFLGKNSKVEAEIRTKNYKGLSANLMRVSASSIKTVLCYASPTLRILTAGVFAYIAKKSGMRIFNQGSNLFTKEDQQKLDADPESKKLYELGRKLYILSSLCAGMTTFFSLSPGYLYTSGKSSAFAKMAAGGLLILTALSNFMHLPDIISRTIFYASGPTYLLSHALRTIYRSRQYVKRGLTSAMSGA